MLEGLAILHSQGLYHQKITPENIEPKFLDYEKDITHSILKSNIPLLYNKNTENNLFELFPINTPSKLNIQMRNPS